jgi:hypothetical protein
MLSDKRLIAAGKTIDHTPLRQMVERRLSFSCKNECPKCNQSVECVKREKLIYGEQLIEKL